MSGSVVITGVGAVSSAGADVQALWDAVEGSTPAWKRCADGVPGGGVDFSAIDRRRFVANKQLKFINDKSALGIEAAGQAITDADVGGDEFSPFEVGVFSASSSASFDRDLSNILARLDRMRDDRTPVAKRVYQAYNLLVHPMELLRNMVSAPQDHIAVSHTFRGSTCTFLGGAASGLAAMREAARPLRRGVQRAMVVIGSDQRTQRSARRALARLGDALFSGKGEFGPYDPTSRGYVPGEAGAALVMESETSARTRSRRPYARLRGVALRHDVDPAKGLARAMRAALDQAELPPEIIDVVVGAGSGDATFDEAERRSIEACFEGASPTLVATRGVIGHSGAASGLVDVVAAALMLRSGRVPGAADCAARRLLLNSFGDSGEAASMVLERVS